MNNAGLTTTRTIPSTAGAQETVKEVNTKPPEPKTVMKENYWDHPENIDALDWSAHFSGLGQE